MTCYLYKISFTVKWYYDNIHQNKVHNIIPDHIYSFLMKNDFCIVYGADCIDDIISETEFNDKIETGLINVAYMNEITLTLSGEKKFINKLKLML